MRTTYPRLLSESGTAEDRSRESNALTITPPPANNYSSELCDLVRRVCSQSDRRDVTLDYAHDQHRLRFQYLKFSKIHEF